MELSVSILSANNRIKCINKLNNTTMDYFHMDVMDGFFVNNLQLPIDELKSLAKHTKKPLDIHLMVENPEYYLKDINEKNIEYITFHLEVNKDINEIINIIKEKGYKVGISIKPTTRIEELYPYLKDIDLILVMSVEPGQGGQKFIDSSLEKISKLKKIIKENKYNIKIEVDGGVNKENIEFLKNVDTDIVVCGSYIVNYDNYQNQIHNLKI